MVTFDPTFKKRPLSHSQLNVFAWDKEDWYKKYILNQTQEQSPEMIFGKFLAQSIEDGKPLAPVTTLSKVEHEFKFKFSGIHCIGYADTFDDKTFQTLGEFKSGIKPWDQKRVDEHEQLDFYCLGNYIINKIKPDDMSIFLEWVPTKRISVAKSGLSKGEYIIDFVKPIVVHHFKTKRNMNDMLRFCNKIKSTVKEMQSYVDNRSLTF